LKFTLENSAVFLKKTVEFLFIRLTYCIVFFSIAYPALSQDSLKRVVAKDVVVESTRLTEELYPSPSTVTYREAAELVKLSGSSLASSALSLAHPALDIRSYGTQSGIALASFIVTVSELRTNNTGLLTYRSSGFAVLINLR
jgi:hypothetical protein